jgi:hypothetical protein
MPLLPSCTAQTDTDVAEIIDQTDPRELLRMTISNCPSRLYRALHGRKLSSRPIILHGAG